MNMMAPRSVFRGRGGGGGGGDSGGPAPAVRTPDNLRSNDTVEFVLGVSEGDILGLHDDTDGSDPAATRISKLRNFLFGDTPLANVDGTLNFLNFQLTEYLGLEDSGESITPTLGGQSSSQTVGVTFFSNVSVVRETFYGNIDALKLRLLIQQLYLQNDSGVYNNTIQFRLEYKPSTSVHWAILAGNAGVDQIGAFNAQLLANYANVVGQGGNNSYPTFAAAFDAAAVAYASDFTGMVWTLTGKTTSQVVKQVTVPVTRIDVPYQIRVTKLTAESDTTTNFITASWESFQEIVTTPISHEGLAMVHVLGQSSDQLGSLPTFSGVWDGLRFNVPTNYNPKTRVYTGIWDGTFQRAFSNNAAYFLQEYVKNSKWGMNFYSPIDIDKWDVYEAAQWCDTMVPDGDGGLEPRFTFNSLISDARNGKDLAKYIAGTFNGMFFDKLNGTCRLKVDKDDPAVHLFTPENVTAEGFSYSYTDLTTRANDITVSYTSPALNWQTDRRRLVNQADIDANGTITGDFEAVGCTVEREALRRAMYKLIGGLTECEIVKFSTNRLAQGVEPYDVALVADPTMGYSKTGRAKTISLDRLTITLRDPVYFEAGVSYVLRFVTPSSAVVERGIVIDATGTQTSFVVDEALPDDMPEMAAFSIEQLGSGVGYGSPKPYRIMDVEEVDGSPDTFQVTALEINRNKWPAIDNLVFTGGVTYSKIASPIVVPSPTNVQFTTGYFRATQQKKLFINVTLDKVSYPYFNGDYDVWYDNGTGYQKATLIDGDTVIDLPDGDYNFKILPKNYLGATALLGNAAVWPYHIDYNIQQPSTPTGLVVDDQYTGLLLRWDKGPEADIDFYEVIQGQSVDTGTLLVTGFLGTRQQLAKTQPGPITFLVRSHAAGRFSEPATVTFNVPRPSTVQNFQCIQNLNTIVFNWDPNPEPDILYYEVVEGLTYRTSAPIGHPMTTRFQIPSNSLGTRTFWIKAVNRATFESLDAAQAVAPFIPLENMNTVVVNDESDAGWPGVKINTHVVSSDLQLVNGKMYGEYVHKVELEGVIYARNLLDTALAAVAPASLAWNAAHFPWNSLQARTPWVTSGDLNTVSLDQLISQRVGLGASDVEGWALNGDLTGEGGTDLTGAGTYTAGRFRQGLLADDLSDAYGDIAVPAEFRLQLWLRPQLVTENCSIVTLKGASGLFLSLRYEAATSRFYLTDSLGNVTYAGALPITTNDVLLAAVIQTASTRRLYIGRLQDESTVMGSLVINPIGAFTSLSLG